MQRVLVFALAAASLLVCASAALSASIDEATRTVKTPVFDVQWSATNPEEILSLSWNGSPNLTNRSDLFCNGDSEFFGNSWDTDNDSANFAAPVGCGTTGTWTARGSKRIDIQSSAQGSFGTSGIPVRTQYQFVDSGPGVNTFTVRRTFDFGATAFMHDIRPYVPRLFPRDRYTAVLHPNAGGTALVTEDANPCDFGCRINDWNGSWFAVHDPASGAGMIVVHHSSRFGTALWIDMEGASQTTASSVALLQPPGGFVGNVTDVQTFCLYDASLWTPSLTLPPGCGNAAADEADGSGG
jgi:hypothetical protein